MRFFQEKFKKFTKEQWNLIVNEMTGSTPRFLWQYINFQSAFSNVDNISFIISEDGKPISVVALAINKNSSSNFFGFGNGVIPTPLFKKNVNNSHRKKIFNYILNILSDIAKKKKIKKIYFEANPIYFENQKSKISSQNQFELISLTSKFIIHNTLIHELKKKTDDELFQECSKYQRKNIKTVQKKNTNFKIINYLEDKTIINEEFKNFQKLHYLSAKKVTRPQKTWDIMKQQIFDNESDLFCLRYKNKSVSYLYCGRHHNFAWGWSQVNNEEYEKYLMPRHLLEWKILLYYKKKKIHFYEMGERYFSQKNFKPSKKLINISIFKEKYGANKYPRVIFELKL